MHTLDVNKATIKKHIRLACLKVGKAETGFGQSADLSHYIPLAAKIYHWFFYHTIKYFWIPMSFLMFELFSTKTVRIGLKGIKKSANCPNFKPALHQKWLISERIHQKIHFHAWGGISTWDVESTKPNLVG